MREQANPHRASATRAICIARPSATLTTRSEFVDIFSLLLIIIVGGAINHSDQEATGDVCVIEMKKGQENSKIVSEIIAGYGWG